MSSGPDGLMSEFYLAPKSQIVPILSKLLQNIEELKLPNPFYKMRKH